MRIVHVLGSQGTAYAGTERMVDDLCSYLARSGHNVTLVTGEGCPIRSSLYQVLSFPLGEGARSVLRFGERLRDVVRTEDPQLIHSHLTMGLAAARWAHRGRSVPVVYTEHFIRGRSRYRWSLWLKRQLLRNVSVVAVSRPVAKALEELLAKPVSVIYNGSDFRRTAEPRLPGGPVSILWCGRVAPEKRLDKALAVVRVLSGRRPCRLHVVGDGAEGTAAAKRLAQELGIDTVVTFHGWVSDVQPYYNQAHVLLMTSDWEPFGYVALDALVSGLPLVVTSNAGIAELLSRGAGRAVAPGASMEEWADALEEVLSGDPPQILSETAYSVETMATRYMDVYRRALSRDFYPAPGLEAAP